MPITYDENGLAIQTQTEIRDELFDELDGAFGVPMHRNPAEDPLAQLVESVCEAEALSQQALLALHRARDPDGAIGRPLDASLGLTGTRRKGETYSYVNGTLTFSGAATVPNGYQIRNDATNEVWEVTDGPHTRPDAGTLSAQVTAVEPGEKLAAAGSTWSNVSVVANVDGFTNPSESATVGRDRETDANAQRRRKRELYAQGQGPLGAIEGALLRAEGTGIVGARVYHNPDTSPVDSDGIPFKAINAVLETSPTTPTSEQETAIRAALFSALGGGGQAYGTDVVGYHTDSEGTAHEVNFDLVSVLNIKLKLTLITSTSEKAASPNLTAVVAAAVLELAQAEHQESGRDVLKLDYSGEVARLKAAGLISGVAAVTVEMSIDPATPTEVDLIPVSIRQRAAFDAARIEVVTA